MDCDDCKTLTPTTKPTTKVEVGDPDYDGGGNDGGVGDGGDSESFFLVQLLR